MLHYNETKQYTKQKQDIVVLYFFPDKFVTESLFNQMLEKLLAMVTIFKGIYKAVYALVL